MSYRSVRHAIHGPLGRFQSPWRVLSSSSLSTLNDSYSFKKKAKVPFIQAEEDSDAKIKELVKAHAINDYDAFGRLVSEISKVEGAKEVKKYITQLLTKEWIEGMNNSRSICHVLKSLPSFGFACYLTFDNEVCTELVQQVLKQTAPLDVSVLSSLAECKFQISSLESRQDRLAFFRKVAKEVSNSDARSIATLLRDVAALRGFWMDFAGKDALSARILRFADEFSSEEIATIIRSLAFVHCPLIKLTEDHPLRVAVMAMTRRLLRSSAFSGDLEAMDHFLRTATGLVHMGFKFDRLPPAEQKLTLNLVRMSNFVEGSVSIVTLAAMATLSMQWSMLNERVRSDLLTSLQYTLRTCTSDEVRETINHLAAVKVTHADLMPDFRVFLRDRLAEQEGMEFLPFFTQMGRLRFPWTEFSPRLQERCLSMLEITVPRTDFASFRGALFALSSMGQVFNSFPENLQQRVDASVARLIATRTGWELTALFEGLTSVEIKFTDLSRKTRDSLSSFLLSEFGALRDRQVVMVLDCLVRMGVTFDQFPPPLVERIEEEARARLPKLSDTHAASAQKSLKTISTLPKEVLRKTLQDAAKKGWAAEDALVLSEQLAEMTREEAVPFGDEALRSMEESLLGRVGELKGLQVSRLIEVLAQLGYKWQGLEASHRTALTTAFRGSLVLLNDAQVKVSLDGLTRMGL